MHSVGVQTGVEEAVPLLFSSLEPSETLTKPVSLQRARYLPSWKLVVLHCIGIAIIADVAEYLNVAPTVRVFESIICTDYYRSIDASLIGNNGEIPEQLCKVNIVQEKLASILGWQTFFESIPAFLLPLVYGSLADKYGRKWFTVLALSGFTLSRAFILFAIGILRLPLQYVWLNPLFFLVGGGPAMASTLVVTIVADVAPTEKRSTAFFYTSTGQLIAECFVPPIASALMIKSPWIPLLMGQTLLVLSVILTLALPETLHTRQSDSQQQYDATRQVPSERDSLLPQSGLRKPSTWKGWIDRAVESFSFATRTMTISSLIFTFFVTRIACQSLELLLQYVSKRYGWTLSEAGLLLSLRAAVNILLFTVILPFIATTSLGTSEPAQNDTPNSKDLLIAKGSIVLMTLGALILSISFTPVLMIVGLIVYTLGTGLPLSLRSFLTTLVDASTHQPRSHSHPPVEPNTESLLQSQNPGPSDIGRLYALLQIMEGVGALIAGPGMAWLFRIGMRLGPEWLGLPFGVAAGLLGVFVGGIIFWAGEGKEKRRADF